MSKKTPWQVRAGSADLPSLLYEVIRERIHRWKAGQLTLKVAQESSGPDQRFRSAHVTKLFFQLIGTNRFLFPNCEMDVRAGELCIIPSGVPHGELRIRHRGRYSHIFSYLTEDSYFYHLQVLCPDVTQRQGVIVAYHHTSSQIGFARKLLKQLSARDMGSTEIEFQLRDALLFTLLSSLLVVIDQVDFSEEGHPLTSQCRSLVRRKLADHNLSVFSLSQELGVNPDYLSRIFHAEEGKRLKYYINEQRVQLAKNLIENGDVTLGEVSDLCGFSDQAYFTRVFREWVGVAPSKYRKAVRP
ncbi:MAG: helix-turn-helix transcriptional regulator [Verrucomicrobiota bacterium]